MLNRVLFAKDPLVSTLLNNGVAKVSEPGTAEELRTLRFELENFVCEGEYARGLERILRSFLDNVGNHSPSDMRRALTRDGVLQPNGGGHSGGALGPVMRAFVASLFVRQQLRPSVKFQNRASLQVLKELIEAGKVNPVMDGTYPLRETPMAIEHVAAGHARGTVVIAIDPVAA